MDGFVEELIEFVLAQGAKACLRSGPAPEILQRGVDGLAAVEGLQARFRCAQGSGAEAEFGESAEGTECLVLEDAAAAAGPDVSPNGRGLEFLARLGDRVRGEKLYKIWTSGLG